MALLLVYHKIAPQREFGANVIHPTVFAEQMRMLFDLGYRTAPVSSAIDNSDEKCVAVMFDDAYENVHAYAFPILSDFGFVATIAVITKFVGRSNSWDFAVSRTFDHMGWHHIRELHACGWEVASHTCRHRCLPILSSHEAAWELGTSKSTLEDKLGTSIGHMVYPYGRTSQRVARLVQSCGYASASGFFGTGRYDTSRTPIYGFDNKEIFLDKLRGNIPELWKTRVVNLMTIGSIIVQFLKEKSGGRFE